MTNASSSTTIRIEHRFTVPNNADASDLSIALHWAKTKAKELGIDTSFDDWCRIETTEGHMSLVVTETKAVLAETIALERLVAAAKSLASDDGENAEYDRALVELVASVTSGDTDWARERAEHQILGLGKRA